jgi:nucleoid DNA-binding protein
MYNEIQIRQILESKIEILKKADAKKHIPEFTEVYKESVEYAERISIHSEIGKFPYNLF